MPRKKKTDVPAEDVTTRAATDVAESSGAVVEPDTVSDAHSDAIAEAPDLIAADVADGPVGDAPGGSPDDELLEDADVLNTQLSDRAITFRLEDQLYGMPIGVVQEIQQIAELQPLPDEDPALVGLIDLRGTVVPVLDLRVLVGLPRKPYVLETPMIFCRSRDHLVCLVVETVEDVVDLTGAVIQPPSSLYSLADRMLGVCRLPQGLVLLLDIEAIVPGAALAIADQMGGGVT